MFKNKRPLRQLHEGNGPQTKKPKENSAQVEDCQPKDLSPTTILAIKGMIKDAVDESTMQLKDIIMKQNEVIVELLSQNNAYVKQLINQRKEEENIVANFPIETIEALKQLNQDLADETTFELNVKAMKLAITQMGGLSGAFKLLFSTEVITGCNYDGVQGKFEFKSLTNMKNALFKAAYTKDYTQKTYIEEIRKGFNKCKKAHFKKVCIERKKNMPNDAEDAENSK